MHWPVLVKQHNKRQQPDLGIPNEIRYFGAIGGTFRYRNTEYSIGTDTDTEWMIPNDFFGIIIPIFRIDKESL